MDRPYRKTDAGRREIRERALALSRPARNLLLIIDPTRDGVEWLDMVAGCSETDLLQLLADGLIEEAARPLPASPPVPQAAAPSPPLVLPMSTLVGALQVLGYQPLYDLLTGQARPQLGLIKGYRMILDIEKCSGIDELRALVPRFVAQIVEVRGDDGLRALAQQLPRDGTA